MASSNNVAPVTPPMTTPRQDYQFDDAAVVVRHACKTFGLGKNRHLVLNELHMTVDKGTIYGLLGASGCGKTTLLSCVTGIRRLSSGMAQVLGAAPGTPGLGVPGRRVGFMPQEMALLPDFSIRELLFFFGRLHGLALGRIKEQARFLLSFLELPKWDRRIADLSGGQQRRVSFALALLHQPELLILDEPTVGLDPLLRQSIWRYLMALVSTRQHTIIITTHYIEEARQAHKVGFLRSGRLLAEGSPEDLVRQHDAITLEETFLRLCLADPEGDSTPSDSAIAPAIAHAITPAIDHAAPAKQFPPAAQPAVAGLFQSQKARNMASTESVVALSFHQSKEVLVETISYPNNNTRGSLSGGHKPATDTQMDDPGSSACGSAQRILAILRKNLKRLHSNISYVVFSVVLPVTMLSTFCLSMGKPPHNLDIGVVNDEFPGDPLCHPYDGCAFVNLSCRLLHSLDDNTVVFHPFPDVESALDAVRQGNSWGVLHFPQDYSDNLVLRYNDGLSADNVTVDNSNLRVHLDASNEYVSVILQKHLLEGFRNFSRRLLEICEFDPDIGDLPLVFGEFVYGGDSRKFLDFTAPGITLMIVFIFSMSLIMLAFILERREGMVSRLQAAGVRPYELAAGHVLTEYILMCLQISLVVPVAFFVFDLPYNGPLGWIVVILVLHGTSGITLGTLISALAEDELMAVHMAIAVCFLLLIVGGIVWPLEAMPDGLRHFSYLLPTTLGVEALRNMMVRGWGLLHPKVWMGFLVPTIWSLVNIVLLAITLRFRQLL